MKGEIKPCPHGCNSAVNAKFSSQFRHWVECYGGCRGPICSSGKEAIARWNDRTSPPCETARAGDGETGPETMVENLRYSWRWGLFEAVENNRHVSDRDAADMIEKLVADRDRASDAAATMQRERDEAREMSRRFLTRWQEMCQCIDVETAMCDSELHAAAEALDAFLARYEGAEGPPQSSQEIAK